LKRLAVDVGGTFTDVVYVDEDTMQVKSDKVRSTPDDPIRGVMEAIKKVKPEMGEAGILIFGSTVGLNTLLQKKGARVALLTTHGFTDVLEMARGDRKELYNNLWKKPPPLVPRYLRLGVNERTNSLGQVVKKPEEADIKALVKKLTDNGVEAVAVCLLHSYANPENEQMIGKILENTFPPEAISLSHEVVREFREYERSSSTVLDAYIKKSVVLSLERLEKSLDEMGFSGQVLMASPNGALGIDTARHKAIATLNSGPIGGTAGAEFLARLIGVKNLVTMDVGGTSFDISVIKDGRSLEKYEIELLGYPVLMPGIDLRSIGAGGGSIAWIDAGGMLQVGPQSAGAVPGPMCYGLGGMEPTVTDAAVVNGLIDPESFATGEISLNQGLAEEGIEDLGKRLGLNLNQTADGILTIVRDNMNTAAVEILVRQGFDPREFAIMSFGGGGGIFTTVIARDMGIAKVIVPTNPAVFCAWGMLTMDLVHNFSQTYFKSIDTMDMFELEQIYEDMEKNGREILEREKITREDISFIRSLDMCYEGQGHYVEVPVASNRHDKENARSDIVKTFHHLHEMKFGHKMATPPRIINIRLKAIGKTEQMQVKEITQGTSIPPGAVKAERDVYLDQNLIKCRVYDRFRLTGGNILYGPAIIEEPFHNTLIMAGQSLTVDKFGNLIIDTGAGKKQ
jgi:N-methylhydantoinase A